MKCALTLMAEGQPPRDIDTIDVPTAPYPGDTIKVKERVYMVVARSFMPPNEFPSNEHRFGCAVQQLAGPPHVMVATSPLSLVKN